jgi:hypothetical protein
MLSENTIRDAMKELFPNGDPKFLEIMMNQIDLYNRKNKDYASAKEGEEFDPNGNFNRVSTIMSLYPGLSLSDPRVFALALLMKQFDQVCWSLSRGFEGEVEGLDPKLQDIVVYFVIIRCLNAHMAEQRAALEAIVEEMVFEESGAANDVLKPQSVPCIECGVVMTLGPKSIRRVCWECDAAEVTPLDSDRAWCQCGCGNTVVGHEVLNKGLRSQGIGGMDALDTPAKV